MKKAFLLVVTILLYIQINSQTIQDAIRYSSFDVGGTARTVGIGGGIGALGADFSAMSTNPAGLAAYRRSEFTLTPSLVFSNTKSELQGGNAGQQEDNRTNFNFNNVGLVIARRPLSSAWKTANFAVGFNRLANFHENIFSYIRYMKSQKEIFEN